MVRVRRFFTLLFFFPFCICSSLTFSLFAENAPPASARLYKEKRWSEAILECEKEIKMGAGLESYITLTSSYFELKDWQKVYLSAKDGRAQPRGKYNPRLLDMQALACYNLGRNIEALNLLQTYLRTTSQEKDVSEIYYHMGELYARLSQYSHADMAFTAALRLRPHNVEWWTRLGYVREMAEPNDYDAQYALEAYQKALSLDKNYTDAIIGMKRVRLLIK